MNGQIFISYRREDSSAWAGRLYDRLLAHFPQNQIFIDVDNLDPGIDYFEAIEESVGACDVLIAVIGRRWLNASDVEGRRRLEKPGDLVRLEIAAALKRNIRVIPVLVDGASMPDSNELPDNLKQIARRNAVEVGHSRFNADLGRLIAALERVFEKVKAQPEKHEESPPLPTTQGDPELALYRGQVFYDKKEYDKAISDFTEAIRLKSNYVLAYIYRGRIFFRKKEYDKAISDFAEAVRFSPNDASGHFWLGSAYIKKSEYDKALSAFDEAIGLDPKSAPTHLFRADAFSQKEEYDKAINDYTEAIRLDPNWASPYDSRGHVYEKQGKLDKAKADFAKAEELKKAGK